MEVLFASLFIFIFPPIFLAIDAIQTDKTLN